MIDSDQFIESLQRLSVDFYTGVPDSLLKSFCACLLETMSDDNHIIAANEGAAVALAAGHYLATGRLPLVYLQNSGLGNAINPLLSLADPEVYSIPVLLMIGWRGHPGVKDEPQHRKQGRVQNALLQGMEIPHFTLNAESDYEAILKEATALAFKQSGPVALVVEKNTFLPFRKQTDNASPYPMTREEAIKAILSQIRHSDIVVSTTGMTSREIFEYRSNNEQGHHQDFLTVGSMGHCSQIALGISLEHKHRKTYCIDGDGAVIMHMGSLSVIGAHAKDNFVHILLNNGSHDSVGGQPTAASTTDFAMIAKASGYQTVRSVRHENELMEAFLDAQNSSGPVFLEVFVKKGARKDLGRPNRTPAENKLDFMKHLDKNR